jgi:hypothetical protein
LAQPGRDRTLALLVGDRLRCPLDDVQEVRAGAHAGVHDDDRLGREPQRQAELVTQQLLGQPGHRVDDGNRGVVGTRLLPQLGVIHLQEVLI